MRVLGRPDARDTDSFVDLGGDSLSYVELATRLAEASAAPCPPAGTPAASASWSASPPRGPSTDAEPAAPLGRASTRPSRLRALAILFVVASHVDLVALEGGAHLLLALAGFNFARFQLSAAGDARTRLRHGLSGLAQLLVPSVLWVGAVARRARQLRPDDRAVRPRAPQQLRVGRPVAAVVPGVAGVAHGGGPRAHLPARLHRLERRTPFRFALALLAVTAAARFADVGLRAGPTQRYTTLVVAFVFVLGWLGARADTTRRRLVVVRRSPRRCSSASSASRTARSSCSAGSC